MDRLEQLERSWLFYKLRWFLKHGVVVLMALVIGGGVVYFFASGGSDFSQTKPAAKEVKVTEPAMDALPTPPAEPKVVIKEVPIKPVQLAPNFDFEAEIRQRLNLAQRAPAAQPPRTPAVTRSAGVEVLEAQFTQNPSYSKAVEIAEAYLAQNAYEKALSWSLKANEINNEDERSWAVFATASAELGRTEQATSSLRAYLRVRPSDRLSQLLVRLERP